MFKKMNVAFCLRKTFASEKTENLPICDPDISSSKLSVRTLEIQQLSEILFSRINNVNLFFFSFVFCSGFLFFCCFFFHLVFFFFVFLIAAGVLP